MPNIVSLLFAAVVVTAISGPPVAAQEPVAAEALGSTMDSNTRWMIRTSPTCSVDTAVVRLSDVAVLVGSHAAWDRIKNTPIALIPHGTGGVTIQRDRLASVIQRSAAVPLHIDLIGTKSIRVERTETSATTSSIIATALQNSNPSNPAQSNPAQSNPAQSNLANPIQIVQPVRYATPSNSAGESPHPGTASIAKPASQAGTTLKSFPVHSATYRSTPAAGSIVGSDLEAVRRRVLSSLKRFHPELFEEYEIDLESDAAVSAELASGSILSIDPTQPIGSGARPWNVSIRSASGVQTVPLLIRLTPHPSVLTFRNALPRGTVVREQHLVSVPIPSEDLPNDYAINAEQILGKQIRGNVRPGSPIDPLNLRAPVLVQRGELIEVRVMGGGITVTTNAKALEEGSQSQLIEVETVQNRKRLVGRVVAVGMVEVVTRSPVVR